MVNLSELVALRRIQINDRTPSKRSLRVHNIASESRLLSLKETFCKCICLIDIMEISKGCRSKFLRNQVSSDLLLECDLHHMVLRVLMEQGRELCLSKWDFLGEVICTYHHIKQGLGGSDNVPLLVTYEGISLGDLIDLVIVSVGQPLAFSQFIFNTFGFLLHCFLGLNLLRCCSLLGISLFRCCSLLKLNFLRLLCNGL